MRRASWINTFCQLIGALCIASCGAEPPSDAGTTDTEQQPLVGGTATTARPEVFQLNTAYGGCTATFITPNAFLTASHCTHYSKAYWGSADKIHVAPDCGGPYCIPGPQDITGLMIYGLGTLEGGFGDVAIGFTDTDVSAALTSGARLQWDPYAVTDTGIETKMGFGCTNYNPWPQGSGGNYKQYVEAAGWLIKANCPGDSGGPRFMGHLRDNGPIVMINSSSPGPDGPSDEYDSDAGVPTVAIEDMLEMRGYRAHGLDRPGYDYWNGYAASFLDCRYACVNDPICRAWTYRTASQWCYLKNAAGPTVPNTDAESGLNRGTYYIYGGDMPGTAYSVQAQSNQETCQAACARDGNCFAFVWHKDAYGNTICELKNARFSRVAKDGYASGWRARPEVGYDRPGSDVGHLQTANWGACRDACQVNTSCAAFTYRTDTGTCWLKGGWVLPAPVANANAISMVRHGMDHFWDRPGGDYAVLPYIRDPLYCQATCEADYRCLAWSWHAPTQNYPNMDDNDDGACHLKNLVIPARTTGPGWVSGMRGMSFF